MLDKVCQRYSRLPSEVLELDEFTGYQLDTAMALRFDLKDKDFTLDIVDQILTGMENIMRSQGAKVKKRKKRKRFIPEQKQKDVVNKHDPNYVPTVDELLKAHKRNGTIISNG